MKSFVSVNATLKLHRILVPGQLQLGEDRILFKGDGILEGTEIKDTFYLSEIKSLKICISLMPHRIVIHDNSNEAWIFEQVHYDDGKYFIEQYEALKNKI